MPRSPGCPLHVRGSPGCPLHAAITRAPPPHPAVGAAVTGCLRRGCRPGHPHPAARLGSSWLRAPPCVSPGAGALVPFRTQPQKSPRVLFLSEQSLACLVSRGTQTSPLSGRVVWAVSPPLETHSATSAARRAGAGRGRLTCQHLTAGPPGRHGALGGGGESALARGRVGTLSFS